MATMRWTCAMYLGKFLEGSAMSRKKDSWEELYRPSHSVHHYTVPPPTPSAAGQGSKGKSKGAVNSLKSAASGLASAKRELNSSLREATTLTQLSGSTSSGTQAARRGKLSNWPLANCASHNRSFTSKTVMCACMAVTRMYLPCSFTIRAFRCVVISVSRARRASHRGSKNWSA